MQIDAAVVAYYNMFRTQGWHGNLALVVERELFGQASISEFIEPQTAMRIEEQLRRLGETIMPLQNQAHRMMTRALAAIR